MSFRSQCLSPAFVVLLAALLGGCRGQERPTVPTLVWLHEDDPELRTRAVIELLPLADDPVVVAHVLFAAKMESNHAVLRAMLRLLGASGALEALGLIQLHAQSPASDLRSAARAALKTWLHANHVAVAEGPLPDPPHPAYAPPPWFSPDRPAGHSLPARMSYPPGTLPPGPTVPPPLYEPPPADLVPPGFRFDRVPRWGPTIGGAVTFGAMYIGVASVPIIAALGGDQPGTSAWLAVPVAGPAVVSAELFADSGLFAGLSHLAGGILIVDGLGQLAGLTMLTIGLAHRNWQLAPEVSVGTTGSTLDWRF